MAIRILTVLSLAALGLAACNNNGRGAAAGICKPFATASTNPAAPTSINATPAMPAAGDPAATLDDCLHRWGYTLAASTDPANLVADATLAACSSQITGWNQTALGADNAGGAVQAPSLLTGQPTNAISEHHNFAEGRALFYVVQARAGHCAAPPASSRP